MLESDEWSDSISRGSVSLWMSRALDKYRLVCAAGAVAEVRRGKVSGKCVAKPGRF